MKVKVGQWVNLSLNSADTDALVLRVDGTKLDLIIVSEEGKPVTLKGIPHYKDLLVTAEEEREFKTKKGVKKDTQVVTRRQPGDFWRD